VHEINNNGIEIRETNEDTVSDEQAQWDPPPQFDPFSTTNFGKSLMMLRDKLANEEDWVKIVEMKTKIKDMLEFYDG